MWPLSTHIDAPLCCCALLQAGYYCTGGYQYSCGSNAYYCPGTGNSGPTTVSTGYYSTGGSSSTRTGQAICEVRMKRGMRVCVGHTHPSPCFIVWLLSVQPGYQCNSGVKTDCGGDNVYCPEGTSTPLPVSTGFYSTGGTSTTRSGQSQCTVMQASPTHPPPPPLTHSVHCKRFCLSAWHLLQWRRPTRLRRWHVPTCRRRHKLPAV